MQDKAKSAVRSVVAACATVLMAGCGSGGGGSSGGGGGGGGGSATADLTGSITGADSSYEVILVEASTNEATMVAVSGSSFTVSVDSGDYAIALLDEDNTTVGLLVQNGESFFDLSGTVALGAISWDDSTGIMSTNTSLTASAMTIGNAAGDPDLSDMTGVTAAKSSDGDNGVELGDVLEDGDGDSDDDLVPDFLDNDNNENGVYDSLEGMDICRVDIDAAAGDSTGLADLQEVTCTVFDNLKLGAQDLFDGSGDPLPHADRHVITFHMDVPDTLASLIDSVEVVGRPSYAEGTVSMAAGGYTFTGYPTAGSDWADSDFALAEGTQPGGETAWCLWVVPDSVPYPAVYQIEITLSNGTVATYTTRLAFVFNTPPKVTEIDDGVSTTTISYPVSNGDPGTFANPVVIDSGSTTVSLTGDRPLTGVGGTEICGMSLQAHIFYFDASNNPLNVVTVTSPLLADTGTCDPSVDMVLELDTATYFPATYEGTAVQTYQIDFTVVAPQGDNSAEIFYLSR